jgi:osmoprotectant transport system ATP-binding protein
VDDAMISLRGVSKRYEGQPTFAVADVDLDVAEGELVILLGESGCGKTTTLKMINRLIEPSGGTITINGEDTRTTDPVALRRGIGYVFQRIGLFPHMTVADNIASVPRLLGWAEPKIAQRVDELLDLMGLEPEAYRLRRPAQLSGGQQQRVGVARALAAQPRVLLMDEPFGALDPITRDTLQTEFRSLQRRLGLTVVMVTHDMTEALLLADRLAIMQEGVIKRIGGPRELLRDPGDPYVAQLLATPKRQADFLEELARPEDRS